MFVKLVLGIVFCVVHETTSNSCDIIENKLDILFNCCQKLINDDNFYSTFESIQQNTEDAKNVNVFRQIHILMENNNVSYLRRLPTLSHVNKISFKNNRIADADTGVFRNLPHLRVVDLGFNELTGDKLTAEIFRGNESEDTYQPLSLEYLVLSNNRLTYLRQDLFKYLPNLQSLELNNNPLNHINAETERALHSLKKLKILNMAEVGISQIPNMLFEAIPIVTLYLNENQLVEVPWSLSQSSTIRYLNLNANPIREIDAKSFTKLIRLQELHLSGMKNLTQIKENAFLTLVNLGILQCSFNPNLRSIHERAFSWKTSRKLKELYINNNALHDISETLIDWKKLKTLDIRDNPWNCTCALQWLYELIEERQHYDPEANLGVLCRYPDILNKRSFIFASGFLKCDTENEVVFLRSSKSKEVVVCIGVLLIIYVILQLAYFKIMRNKQKPRHSGTSIKSTVKYKPAQSMVVL